MKKIAILIFIFLIGINYNTYTFSANNIIIDNQKQIGNYGYNSLYGIKPFQDIRFEGNIKTELLSQKIFQMKIQ